MALHVFGMSHVQPPAAGRALPRALQCLFTSGAAAVLRGAAWGFVFGLPAGCYCFFSFPYGGGLIAGPFVAFVGPLVGVVVAFHLGAATGLYRAGYRWELLLVPALAAALALVPYGLYIMMSAGRV